VRFDADFLRALDHLRFVSGRTFSGSGRGERRGRHRGRGIEFADYRPYAQGDDFRHIDWKAYKRLGRLLVRLFDEEQDLHVYLFIDTSSSMALYGKLDHALRLAAALCYIGVAHLDRVSILPFTDRLGREVSAGHARQTVSGVLAALETVSASGETDLWRTVREFSERSHRQGLAVVISDFLDPAGCERALKLLAARGHDVVALHVAAVGDRSEVSAADAEATFVDAETGEERTVEITPALLEAHAEAWADFDREVEATCARSRAQYLRTDPDVPIERTVLATLRTGRFLE
jgi:uncharacterized protein (DUF58 family)